MTSNPFITVYAVDGRANKLVTRSRGKITKKAGPPMSEAVARTVRVDTVDEMAGVLHDVGKRENALISLGYTPGTEPADGEMVGPPYTVLSREKLVNRLDLDPDDGEAIAKLHEVDGGFFAVRSKRSMVPGGWMLFDRDITPGMPAQLASMTDVEWLDAMAEMIPGFSDAGLVMLPSTTGRVLVDGEPMEASGSHYFVRIADGDDIERFGAVLLNTAFRYDYGFMRPVLSHVDGSVVSNRAWFIADPSTFSHERLIYDGKPTIRGKGLEVGPVEIKTRPGGILQTCDLKNPTKEEIELVRERTGIELRWETRSHKIGGSWQRRLVPIHLDTQTLTLDTVIETESGDMVLREYWGSGHGKLRCQTPFRDSTSWNGILSFHSNGTPFVFDNGSRTKFVLPDDVVEREHPKAWMSQLRQMPTEDISRRWTEQLETMSPTSQDEVRKAVHDLTRIDLGVLKAELSKADTRWKAAAQKRKNREIVEKASGGGRIAIWYDAAKVPSITSHVEEAVFEDPDGDPVMGYGQALVSVIQSHPQTVREVEAADDGDYPLMPIIKAFKQEGLAMRLSEDVAFFVNSFGDVKQIAPPPLLLRTMLEVSPERAPGLVGVLEHPAMNPDGEVISGHGYDRATGFFKRIPDDLVPDLPEQIRQEDAAQALKWIIDNVCADFPFDSDNDLAGFLSLLLTAIQRRLISGDEGCPGGGISAPVQASGKTALTQVLFYLVLGRSAAATAWVQDDVEMAKHLLAVLLEGHPAVLFDNLPEGGVIESNELAKAMTSATYSGRVLGENRKAMAPTNVLWLFTGNNVTPTGDFNTRVMLIYLDPNCESPESRTFSRPDLAGWCAENRAKFFETAMTVLVGYYRARAAGNGVDVKPTRYREWDEMIREALIWAGADDPAELFDKNKMEDPMVEGRRNLLAAWHDKFGDKPMTVAEVIQKADGPKANFPHEDPLNLLKTAIHDILPSGNVTSKALGTTISKFQGRWMDGYQLLAAAKKGQSKKGAKLWRVIKK
jgi:hypothetical protein